MCVREACETNVFQREKTVLECYFEAEEKGKHPQQAGARRQGGGRGSLPPQQGVEEKAGRRRKERWEIKRESPARGAVEESVRGVTGF